MSENIFFNRELSWLEFNARVLKQGLRKELPLLERLQFLSIVSSNFDEFFQVRVAATKRMLETAPDTQDASGLTPKLVLSSISARAHQIFRQQQECLVNDIIPGLAKAGLVYVPASQYTPQQTDFLQKLFRTEIFPLLTPLRTDTEAFPHIKNLDTYAGFLLKPIAGIKATLPSSTDKKARQFATMQDIITLYGTQLFPGFEVEETLVFKVARDADFAVDEDSGSNFIHAMEDVLIQRKSSFPVQLVYSGTSDTIKSFLMEKLELAEEDVYKMDGMIDPSGLLELRDADETGKMSFEPWEHFYPADLPEDEPYWDTLKLHDKILHVPYESYEPVVKFLSDAADDDNVLAIKMTLYRTGRDSPIIDALERAAQRGKQVVVLVELKARFDEERNIAWANELEKAGVTVIYGLVNLKVHATTIQKPQSFIQISRCSPQIPKLQTMYLCSLIL